MTGKGLGRAWSAAAGLGLTMGLSAAALAVGGLWLGRWLDVRWGTRPVATIACLIAGVVCGQVVLFRLAVRSVQEMSGSTGPPFAGGAALSALATAFSGLGLLIVPMAAGIVSGLALDRAWGTSPWFTIGAAVAGSGLGLAASVRLVRRSRAREDAAD
jgi:F0F1-type ATP synthase assembly protein I